MVLWRVSHIENMSYRAHFLTTLVTELSSMECSSPGMSQVFKDPLATESERPRNFASDSASMKSLSDATLSRKYPRSSQISFLSVMMRECPYGIEALTGLWSSRVGEVVVMKEGKVPLRPLNSRRATSSYFSIHSPSRSQSRTLTTLIPFSFPSPNWSIVRTVFPKLSLMDSSDLNSLSRVSSDIIVRQTW